MSTILYECVKTASLITDEVLVSFSGGKDSVVTLSLCRKYFKHVVGFQMFFVPDLSFIESCIKYYENKYSIEMIRMPHFMLSEWLRYGILRVRENLLVPVISVTDIYEYVRRQTNIYWIAAGEKINDSLRRRAMIKHSGTIDPKRGRIYPVAYWRNADILAYIKSRRLVVSSDSSKLGHSWSGMLPDQLSAIKLYFPNDYEKIRRFFPLVEARVKQYEYQQIPKI